LVDNLGTLGARNPLRNQWVQVGDVGHFAGPHALELIIGYGKVLIHVPTK
jgi:hypothetical protein